MWLHIRGVGEWTNRLYSYFEKEQARLHNGEIMPIIGNASKIIPTSATNKPISSITPQRDFLAKNLSQLKQSPMAMKAHSLDERPQAPAKLTNENEIDKKENPFNFDAATIAKRSEMKSETTSSEPKTQNAMKFERQISESGSAAIRKIQATLQRTFSRKGNQTPDGYSNEGFISDDMSSSDIDMKVIDFRESNNIQNASF